MLSALIPGICTSEPETLAASISSAHGKATYIKSGVKYSKDCKAVSKYVWADVIIYHIPVWWFQVPFKLKEYIDMVFAEGHENGIYKNDGRSRSSDNPKLHYETEGLLHSRKYMLTTS